jgi:hypothetical protein
MLLEVTNGRRTSVALKCDNKHTRRPVIKEKMERDDRYVLSFSSAQLVSPLPNPFFT